jgi:anti-sigma B factor antagonist
MEEIEANGTNFAFEESLDSGGIPVLALSGDLDISSADGFRKKVENVVGSRPERLVFDLSGLHFMDSSGIAVMVYAANNVAAVELRHPSAIIRRVVEATGLSEILRLEPS